ncbi:MAG: sugar transferase [Actinomycetia bacterium]|nr:sugar transferase [Actinomycetes bacterium]MCP4962475.1 sugar transferase [Actinomycetes bacterium]
MTRHVTGPDDAASVRPVPIIPTPWWKRTFDIVAAIAALVLMAPVAAVTAAAIRLLMGNPVIFRQERAGLGGETFCILKFRTLLDSTDAAGNPLPDSERRHWLGDLLRKTSLDEIPTFVNVIRGDMSVVGPRPLFVRYLERYSDEQAKRHQVRPGLTGLAQTSGRNDVSWDERFELDLTYINSMSLLLDLHIVARTFKTVLRADGADGSVTIGEFGI